MIVISNQCLAVAVVAVAASVASVVLQILCATKPLVWSKLFAVAILHSLVAHEMFESIDSCCCWCCSLLRVRLGAAARQGFVVQRVDSVESVVVKLRSKINSIARRPIAVRRGSACLKLRSRSSRRG